MLEVKLFIAIPSSDQTPTETPVGDDPIVGFSVAIAMIVVTTLTVIIILVIILIVMARQLHGAR